MAAEAGQSLKIKNGSSFLSLLSLRNIILFVYHLDKLACELCYNNSAMSRFYFLSALIVLS